MQSFRPHYLERYLDRDFNEFSELNEALDFLESKGWVLPEDKDSMIFLDVLGRESGFLMRYNSRYVFMAPYGWDANIFGLIDMFRNAMSKWI